MRPKSLKLSQYSFRSILLMSTDNCFPYFGLTTGILFCLGFKQNIHQENTFSSEKKACIPEQLSVQPNHLWPWFLKCGPQAGGSSSTWGLIRNAGPPPCPGPAIPTESETLGSGGSSLSFNASSRGSCLKCENQGLSRSTLADQ